VRGLVALGFAGANVTAPYKKDVVLWCDEVDADSVNTLVVAGGRVTGTSTDAAALEGLATARAAVLGSGGAAHAWITALEARGADVAVFARRDEWPPRVDDRDLVVNATPVKDALLFEPRSDQAVIDLPYKADGRATALVEAARAADCRAVVDGLDVLARQGAASFERWTGRPAPVGAMRSALGLGS